MTVGSPPQIHIAPQGYEKERVYQPAIDGDADEVILLHHHTKTDPGLRYRSEVESELEDGGIKHDSIECDFFDLDDVLGTFVSCIRGLEGSNDIWVNVSSGSKITAIGGVLACMITSAKPYYVRATDYPDEPIASGAEEPEQIPAYPVNLPDQQYLDVLQFIDNEGQVSKMELIRFAQDQNYILLSKYDRQNEKDMYEPIEEEIITPLEESNFIEIRPRANSQLIQLSSRGKDLLDLFGHLVDQT